MEVIPLDDRIRSTTILNTAAPSDAPDTTDVFANDYDDDYGDLNAPPLDVPNGHEPPVAGGGQQQRRYSNKKLLLGFIAGSALLCAMATGGGVAIQRSRAHANRKCTVADFIKPPLKTPKGKSSKTPKAKSSKTPKAKSTTKRPTKRQLLTEEKRKNRMMAELQLGQEDDASSFSSVVYMTRDYLEGWIGKGFEENGGEGHVVRRLQTTGKSSKSPSSSKSPKSSGSSGIIDGKIDDVLATEIDCKCLADAVGNLPGIGAVTLGPKSAKSSKSPKSTSKSKRRLTGTTKSSTSKSSGAGSSSALRTPSTKSSKIPKSSGGAQGNTRPIIDDLVACAPEIGELVTRAPTAGGSSAKSPKSPPAPGIDKPPTTEGLLPPAPRPTPTQVEPPCDKDCDEIPPVIEEIPPPAVTPTVPTPGGGSGGENPPPSPPTPGGGSGGETPPPSPTVFVEITPSPDCDDDEEWSSVDGQNCEDVAEDPNVLCVTESNASGVSASTACPASCNIECLTNCDNDETWVSTNSYSCEDVAVDPIGLCSSSFDEAGKSAVDACPASCNKECFVNCDNDPLWVTKKEETCEDVAADTTGTLCNSKDSQKVPASIACPAACNVECGDIGIITTTFASSTTAIEFLPEPVVTTTPPNVDINVPVDFPTPAPDLETGVPTPQVTLGATVTVGTEEEEKLSPSPSRVYVEQIVTPAPTILVSMGGTVTVSTETTGPPTLPNRDDEETR